MRSHESSRATWRCCQVWIALRLVYRSSTIDSSFRRLVVIVTLLLVFKPAQMSSTESAFMFYPSMTQLKDWPGKHRFLLGVFHAFINEESKTSTSFLQKFVRSVFEAVFSWGVSTSAQGWHLSGAWWHASSRVQSHRNRPVALLHRRTGHGDSLWRRTSEARGGGGGTQRGRLWRHRWLSSSTRTDQGDGWASSPASTTLQGYRRQGTITLHDCHHHL